MVHASGLILFSAIHNLFLILPASELKSFILLRNLGGSGVETNFKF